MSFDYIRKMYGVPAKRGGRVKLTMHGRTREGTITSATHYVLVRFDDALYSVPLHPNTAGLRYLGDPPDAIRIGRGEAAVPAAIRVDLGIDEC